MSKRKIFRLTHLYIGLIAGLVVFVEAVTGAMWVFNSEINSLIEDDLHIEYQERSFITPTRVKEIASNELPGRSIHGVLYDNQEIKPVEVIFYEAEPEFYYSLFLNPYDGTVLKHEDHLVGFFAFVLDGHLNLWLPNSIGEPIVSYGTLLFLVSIITGIVLWWPRNRKVRKQRFTLDWKATTRWRRKNFDLHTVLGFYAASIALIFAVTGLVMGLNWFYFIYYNGIGGDKEMRFVIPQNTSMQVSRQSSIDQLPAILSEKYSKAEDFEIHYPYADSVSIYVEVSYQDGIYYDADYLFFDSNTLEEVPTPSIYGKRADADISDSMMRMNYDIHVGAVLGLPTKILAFLMCLLIASLPITGVVIWVGRTKKKAGKMSAIIGSAST